MKFIMNCLVCKGKLQKSISKNYGPHTLRQFAFDIMCFNCSIYYNEDKMWLLPEDHEEYDKGYSYGFFILIDDKLCFVAGFAYENKIIIYDEKGKKITELPFTNDISYIKERLPILIIFS